MQLHVLLMANRMHIPQNIHQVLPSHFGKCQWHTPFKFPSHIVHLFNQKKKTHSIHFRSWLAAKCYVRIHYQPLPQHRRHSRCSRCVCLFCAEERKFGAQTTTIDIILFSMSCCCCCSVCLPPMCPFLSGWCILLLLQPAFWWSREDGGGQTARSRSLPVLLQDLL